MPEALRLEAFLLVSSRVTAFMVSSPLFSLRDIPALARTGLGVLVALLLFTAVPLPADLPGPWLEYVFLVTKEIFVGLTLGIVSTMVYNSLRTAGELIDLQTGFGMANLFDPVTGSSTSLLGQYLSTLGILVFLELDGHHLLIRALADSFSLLPLGKGSFGGPLTSSVITIFIGVFVLGLRLAAPVVAVLLVSDIALALVARTVPQLNVFILGFPIKAGLAILLLSLLTPVLAALVGVMMGQMEKDLATVLAAMQP
ncbi:MAG: flagellar type III secretion system protein FliR [Clostridia bacterium]|nr:MAG: flagellar type III secretion system protein FliR [Clostridia bacterium]